MVAQVEGIMAKERKLFIGVFDTEEKLLAATKQASGSGLSIYDCYTPYAVHGLDQAMGMPQTRMPWVSLLCGVTGLATAIGLQVWTSAVDWPINVGGKPFVSIPAFVPISFELTVLFTGLGSVGFFLLYRNLKPTLGHVDMSGEGATIDKFILAIDSGAGTFSEAQVRQMMTAQGALESKWYEEN